MLKLLSLFVCCAFIVACVGGPAPKDPASRHANHIASQPDAHHENPGNPSSQAGMQQSASPVQPGPANGANLFNPYMTASLPTVRKFGSQGEDLLGSIGGARPSIQAEAAHRPTWRQELYPVVFGSPTAAHEILVLLDFSSPASARLWQAVSSAARSLNPATCKIVVFGNSREHYGTDLMGFGIWLAQARPALAMDWYSHALNRWNEVKAAQRAAGRLRAFKNEYDATASPSDYPIHYNYLARLNPPIPEDQELAISRYSYDAGNVNMYQAVQIASHYGIASLPAIVVDGRVLRDATPASILAATR